MDGWMDGWVMHAREKRLSALHCGWPFILLHTNLAVGHVREVLVLVSDFIALGHVHHVQFLQLLQNSLHESGRGVVWDGARVFNDVAVGEFEVEGAAA